MTKEEARERLSKLLVSLIYENPFTNEIGISLPISDINTPIESVNDNGNLIFQSYSFKHLIKIAYDL